VLVAFIFCKKLEDTFFYFNIKDSIFYEIEVENYVEYGEKCSTQEFTVLRELSKKEIVSMCPTMFGLMERFLANF